MFSKIQKRHHEAIIMADFCMDNAPQHSLSKLDKYNKRTLRLNEYKPRHQCSDNINQLLIILKNRNMQENGGTTVITYIPIVASSKKLDNIDHRRP